MMTLLDKNLAKMDEKQLREALQKQGLSSEKVEELLKKAAACRSASNRCSRLGDAMASCGAGSAGLSGDELGALFRFYARLRYRLRPYIYSTAPDGARTPTSTPDSRAAGIRSGCRPG